MTLVMICVVCSGVHADTSNFNVEGKWISVDFVEKISDFDPNVKSWTGRMFIDVIEYDENGVNAKYGVTLKKGSVYTKSGKNVGDYVVKIIEGKEYLIQVWQTPYENGKTQNPMYCVLKRD
jgi:bla regulator protein blaR1